MVYKRTQIYLDPEEHRRLVREAAERGLSLTEYLRRVIGDRAGEERVSYAARTWDALIGIIDSGPKDTVDSMDEEVAEAFDQEHRRGRRRRPKSSPRS